MDDIIKMTYMRSDLSEEPFLVTSTMSQAILGLWNKNISWFENGLDLNEPRLPPSKHVPECLGGEWNLVKDCSRLALSQVQILDGHLLGLRGFTPTRDSAVYEPGDFILFSVYDSSYITIVLSDTNAEELIKRVEARPRSTSVLNVDRVDGRGEIDVQNVIDSSIETGY
jgi:hypothetical protein